MTEIKPVTIPLSEPVTLGEGEQARTFAEITFTRMRKGKDMIAADAVTGETRRSFAVYASMASVPIQVFNEMSFDDIQAVMKGVAPFLARSVPDKKGPAKEVESPNSGEM